MARHGARQVAVAALAILWVVGIGAQTPQPAPTFRSEIDYVQIPVRVLDARGEFVRGLTQSDFQIFEDGQAQTVAAFSEINIHSVPAGAAQPTMVSEVEEGIASSEVLHVDGRVYVFVLDNQNMPAAVALKTRHLMRRFIRDSFAANDVAAVVLTGTGRGQSFTSSPRLLNEAIDRLMSDADPSDNSPDTVLQKIADTAQWMGNTIKGRRKALVLITPSSICHLVNTNLKNFSNCKEAARYALRVAGRSDVSIYTIDPLGIVPTHGSPAEFVGRSERSTVVVRGPLDAARYLAEESGGFAVLNSNSLDVGFARVMRENSAYYLLGYYSTNTRTDGEFRRNKIVVSGRRVRVVYRNGYLARRE
jgi:VWFA-related protein